MSLLARKPEESEPDPEAMQPLRRSMNGRSVMLAEG